MTIYKAALLTCLPIVFVACGFQQYVAKPIDASAVAHKIDNRRPNDSQFHQFLINNGYSPEQLSIQQWGLDELIYCALFFHPSLDVARAQWRAAEAAKLTAAEKAKPTINGNIAKSNNANDDISPYALGLSIDIPIETANKRNIRIENAEHLSLAARLRIAQMAWQLRNQVAQSLYEYQFNQQQIKLLSTEQSQRQGIVAIYQKRISLGESSNIELSTAKLQLQTVTTELNAKQRNQLVLLSKLANSLGLSISQLAKMPLADTVNIEPLASSQINNQATPSGIQSHALLNRLDIRIALERYAATEAKLKLEIAKQYPDISISPGYAYEFGNQVWSLGLSSLLTLLNKNKLAIAEATQLREVEAAQFEALQASVISEVNVANAKLAQANQILENQKNLHQQQQQNTQRMEHRLSAGEIDRLELTYARLEETVAEKNVALGQFQLESAINELENTLQLPLIDSSIKNEKIESLSLDK